MGIEFKNFSEQAKKKLEEAIIAGLYETAGELKSQAADNTRVDTGQLKGSWAYKVDESALEAVIGSPSENAIWEEFGTGEQSINGKGRKGWHGKSASRAFFHAYKTLKNPIIKRLQEKVKDALE